MLLLPLHPPVLEPDFDLPFRQAEGMGDLYPPSPSQITIEVEFLLQLQGLVPCVGLAAAFSVGAWEIKSKFRSAGGWRGAGMGVYSLNFVLRCYWVCFLSYFYLWVL